MFTDFRIWIKIKILSQIEFLARYVTACVCTSLFCIFFHFLHYAENIEFYIP